MKQFLLGLSIAALPMAAMAQQAPQLHWCHADEMRQRLIEQDPTYLEREAAYEAEMVELLRNSAVQRDEELVYVIPIVFHILHAGGDENLPESLILSAIQELNDDYRKLNSDLNTAVPYYQQIAGDVKVEFRLAKIDPDGNCTNGIDRVYTPLTLVGDDAAKFNYWPRNRYMNIWVSRRMGGGAAGYAYYPNALTGVAQIADGVMMLAGSVGNDDNTLTHELGHSFNLAHTWGQNVAGIEGVPGSQNMVEDCSDDGVQDTPLTKGHKPGYCRFHDIDCSSQDFRNTVMTFANMTNGGPLVDNTPIPAEVDTFRNEQPVVVSNMTAIGLSGTNMADGQFGTNGWGTGAVDGETVFGSMTGALDPNKYYEFTIDPTLPFAHRPTQLNFRARRDLDGPRAFAVRASRGNSFATNFTALNSASDPNLQIITGSTFFIRNDVDNTINGCRVNLAALFPSSNPLEPETDETITVRIYAWNAESENGGFYIDSLWLAGKFGVIENVENYMEYSYCSKMFTQGQSDRMRAAMESNVGDRRSLWQAETLNATGTNDGYVAACPPNADFYAALSNNVVPYPSTACSNTGVTFRDNSSGGAATSWSWTFQDGNPATSDLQNPTVQFTSAGWKSVTLTVTNAHGSSTKTNEFAINIGDGAVNPGPYYENFDDDPSLAPFHDRNYGNNHTFWTRYEGAGFSGNSCAKLNSQDRNQLDFLNGTNANDIDDLIGPSINMTGQSGVILSFRYAYSTQTSVLENITEQLLVERSIDCGRTWTTIAPGGTITGAELVTNGNSTVEPPTEWRLKTISLPNSTLGPNNRFRWRFISSPYSNDLYIDDINFGVAVGLDDVAGNAVLMNLFPNPTNDHFTLQVSGMDNERTEVTVMDIRGAQVYTNVYQPTGGANIELSAKDMGLSNGMYLLRVANSNGSSTTKLMIGE